MEVIDSSFLCKYFSSPEVLSESKISKASDVWSFGMVKISRHCSKAVGVVLWELLEIKTPYFDVLSNKTVAKEVMQGTLSLSKPTRIAYPDDLDVIMESCLNFKPSQRPTFEVTFQYQ